LNAKNLMQGKLPRNKPRIADKAAFIQKLLIRVSLQAYPRGYSRMEGFRFDTQLSTLEGMSP